jgi:DNA polymerase-3 subunit delta'
MDELMGQQQAVAILENQLASGRLHHAYIFHGPVGVGKCTTALAFARILLCPNAQPDLSGRVTACGSCESCQLISDPTAPAPGTGTESEADSEVGSAASPHPDLHIIRKELCAVSSVNTVRNRKQMNIPVDLIRELVIGGTTSDGRYHDALAYKSSTMRHGKVFIIDEAELLDSAGQNALLKTLEEPPPGTTLILVTSSEDRLLPTIRSRCQRVAFVPLSDEAVERWLSEQAALPEADRHWLTVFANGSLGRARIALDYDLAEWAKTVLPAVDALARGQPQGELGGHIAKMIDDLAKAWVRDRPKASKEAANKLAAGLMWSMIAAHARQQLRELAEHCEASDPITNEARLEPWLGVIDALREAERLLASNVNLSLVCDYVVSQMDGVLCGAGVRG